MSNGLMEIINFKEKIFSEYGRIKMKFDALENKKGITYRGSDIQNAIILITLLKLEITETGKLPSFFNELDNDLQEVLLQKEENINTHNCAKCALKHVSSAAVIINEILNGYENSDHEIFLMGNLNEASEQIVQTSTELSNELRNLRVDIFETQKRITQSHLRKVKEIYRKLRALTGIRIGKEAMEKQQDFSTENKPCGCKGK
ncbi:hypothetical protein EOM86_14740 [Candidatus Nomurabacteria bacterium]|nr:hypothetical protein [Candidatus Nomurabacteria bacterium]